MKQTHPHSLCMLNGTWYRFLLMLCLTLIILPLGAYAATPPQDTGTWVLDRTIMNSANKDGRLPPGLASPAENGFTYIEKSADGKVISNSVSWSVPPATIPDGGPMTLSLEASSNPGANVSAWWNFSDYGVWSGWKGTKGVNSFEQGIPRSGSMTFTFKPQSSSEAYIQVSAGHDPGADTWYVVTWFYKKRSPGTTGSTTRPTNPGGPVVTCDKEQDAWREAAMKAKLSFSHLEGIRSMITELNREWLNIRDNAYASGAIDVAMLGGSVWGKVASKTKFIQGLFGEAATQTLSEAIVEGAVKGMIKQGTKEFTRWCLSRNIDPGSVLSAVSTKAGDDAGKKVLTAFVAEYLTEDLMSQLMTGKVSLNFTMENPGTSVDQTAWPAGVKPIPGGPKPIPNVRELIRSEYAAPMAEFFGNLISLESALSSASSAHTKLESLRQAIGVLTEQERVRTARWEKLMQDGEVARYAYNQCIRLHPPVR